MVSDKTIIHVFHHISLCLACDPLDGAIFGPSGMIWTNLVQAYQVMLHTKYQDSRSYCFRQDDYSCFHHISLCKTCNPLDGAIFGPRGMIWTNLLQAYQVMLHTKYQDSRSYGFRQDDYSCFSPYKPMFSMWPPGWGHFQPQGHDLQKLV